MTPLSVKTQLLAAFGGMACLVLVVGGLGLHGMSQGADRFDAYVHGVGARLGLATNVRSYANRRAIAVRDLILVKSDADRAEAQAAAEKTHGILHDNLEALKKAVATAPDATDRERALAADIDRVEARYAPVALAILKLGAEGQREAAIDKMVADCRPLLAALMAASKAFADYENETMAQDALAAAQAHATQRAWMIGFAGLSVLAALVLGGMITNRLLRALGAEPAALGAAAQRVARGDLSPVAGARTAPPASVLASMSAMQVHLVDLIGQVRAASENIATASTEIAHGNADLSNRTEQQASALEQTAASMDQLGATVRQNASNAQEAARLSQDAREVAQRGGSVVGEVVSTMKDIQQSSQRIADIIGVIDGIAFQTNILALNAAVEAARAGEQGRGFAVVASEVRSLAGRSADAAKEIKQLIGASVERVERGTSLVDQAGATMQDVVSAIHQVSTVVAEISTASVEQSAGVSQVGEAVTQMDRATQQNAALVEQSAAAAETLKTQAGQLVRSVAQFRLSA